MSVPENNEVWILAFYDTNNSLTESYISSSFIIVISKHSNFFIVLVSSHEFLKSWGNINITLFSYVGGHSTRLQRFLM